MRASSADRRRRREGVARIESGRAALRWRMLLCLEIGVTTTATITTTAMCGRDHSGRVRVTV